MAERIEWVLLAYRLPREPSTPRIALWRRLRKLGAAQVLDGLVALPRDSRTQERFEWLADEVLEAGGEASIWYATSGSLSHERELRAKNGELDRRRVRRRRRGCRGRSGWNRRHPTTHARTPAPNAAGDQRPRLLSTTGARAGTSGGRGARFARGGFVMRWATRANCHVDRAACAWLIRRFVDAEATFVFLEDPDDLPRRRNTLRHAWRRALPPWRRLHVRDVPQALRAGRSGAMGRGSNRPRGRPGRRPLRRA